LIRETYNVASIISKRFKVRTIAKLLISTKTYMSTFIQAVFSFPEIARRSTTSRIYHRSRTVANEKPDDGAAEFWKRSKNFLCFANADAAM